MFYFSLPAWIVFFFVFFFQFALNPTSVLELFHICFPLIYGKKWYLLVSCENSFLGVLLSNWFFLSISANSTGLLLPVHSSTSIKTFSFRRYVRSSFPFFILQFFLVNLLGNKIAFKPTWNVIFRSVLKFWYSPTG